MLVRLSQTVLQVPLPNKKKVIVLSRHSDKETQQYRAGRSIEVLLEQKAKLYGTDTSEGTHSNVKIKQQLHWCRFNDDMIIGISGLDTSLGQSN